MEKVEIHRSISLTFWIYSDAVSSPLCTVSTQSMSASTLVAQVLREPMRELVFVGYVAVTVYMRATAVARKRCNLEDGA